MIKISRFIHPFLFSIYPVLFLYAYNVNQFRENVLIIPALLSLLFGGLVYLLTRTVISFRGLRVRGFLYFKLKPLKCFKVRSFNPYFAFIPSLKNWGFGEAVIKNSESAAVLSSALILVFFSYSRLRDPFKNFQLNLGDLLIGPDRLVFILLLVILIILFFLTFKFKDHLRRVNHFLNIISILLITFALLNIAYFEIRTGRILQLSSISESDETEFTLTSNEKPDIYYFVFDRYAGEKTLNLYGYDNSDFLNYLRDKGFYIASDATSNYPKTFLSLGSTLNLGYINYLTEKTKGGGTSDESIVTPLVKNNKIVKFLKNKGYAYIHVGSGWDPTRSNSNADINFILNGGYSPDLGEFTSGLLHTTAASPIIKLAFPDVTTVSQDPKNNDHRSRILYELSLFDRIPEIPGPKFVFMHILLPHDPYVLGKDCEPLIEEVVASRDKLENYLNQLTCANKKFKVMIEQILTKSPTTPIIVIQPDEGPQPFKYPVPKKLSWKDASDDSLKEKFPILAAYFLPGIKQNPIYPSITPVNTFRIIFNTYFGTKYPLLPDKNYIFEDEENYYKFIDVTERVKPQ